MRSFGSRNLAVLVWVVFAGQVVAQSRTSFAPGAPGKDAQWASAGKQGVGTSNTLESKVWFTLQGGSLTEVFYPTVDIPNVHFLEFVVVHPSSNTVETEREDATSHVWILSDHALVIRQLTSAKNHEWKILKTYVTDPRRNTLLIDVRF